MIQLASDTFDAFHDPMQLDVNEEVIKKLLQLHPSAVVEETDTDGPVMWLLLIPTKVELMNRFLNGEISETELLDQTPLNIKYTAMYLCSAMVLPEYRRKGWYFKILARPSAKLKRAEAGLAIYA